MFERFSDQAHEVVICAEAEARAVGFSHVGSEALLLGLLGEDKGLASQVLKSFDVTAERARAEILKRVGGGEPIPQSTQIPLTPRAEQLLERALREALNDRHNYVRTEHILLAMASVDEGEGINALRAFGLDLSLIREAVKTVARGSGPETVREPPAGPAAIVSSEDDAHPDWIDVLAPGQVTAFRAFQRPLTHLDGVIRDDPSVVGKLSPKLNPDLARRGYVSPEGTIDLIPGPNMICCVVTVTGTGERISGSTSTELAARGAHGFTSRRAGRSATFRGVLAASVRDLRVITASGEVITVLTNEDDAYWITVTDPVDKVLTFTDGTVQHLPFKRLS